MKKKYLIFIFLPLTVIIFCIYLFQQPNEGKIIESGSKDSRVNKMITDEEEIQENVPIITNCFEIKKTQNITNIKQETTENSCVIRAMLIEPIGQITVSFEKSKITNNTQNLKDNTGIKLREKESQTYTEIKDVLAVPQPFELTHPQQFQAKVFTTNTEITGFFWDIKTNSLMTISIHSVARINEKLNTMFWQIVGSARITL